MAAMRVTGLKDYHCTRSPLKFTKEPLSLGVRELTTLSTPPTPTEFTKYHFDETTIRKTTRVIYSQGGL